MNLPHHHLIKKSEDLIKALSELKTSRGLVPTMGNLHQGHRELLKVALEENDEVIFTIFVNPLQFGEGEDFESYPRKLAQDFQKIRETVFSFEGERRVFIFAPESTKEIFPLGHSTTIHVGDLGERLCGHSRPGHFDGVTTVVHQLFNLIKPDKAYFGEKDFQQLQIIKKMTHDLRLPIQVKGVPIVRGRDGLALSSRNDYLSKEQRQQALKLPQTLDQLKQMKNPSEINQRIQELTAEDKNWDYLEILDAQKIRPPGHNTKQFLLAGAYQIGKARLLDNRVIQID